ncbi:hypothetical protein MSG28_013176, partial [Choristoneura fumiferana]
MKTLTVLIVAVLVAGSSGYLIKIPETQKTVRTRVRILNVEVKKVMTMFEPFKFEVTDALKSSSENPMFQDTDDDQKMAMLRKAFQMFDTTKSGYIDVLKVSTILNTMGQLFDDAELKTLIDENDPENSGKINFDGFCNIASHFLEEEDAEAMQQELKEAFRLYDREGNGYITTSTLKEILAALDDKLSGSDLDGIIAEIDTDGSGTVDFDVNAAVSAPADEYQAIITEGGALKFLDESSLMRIVPSGYSPSKTEYFIKPALSEVVDKNKPSYKKMLQILEKGHTSLGLNFNIYDDNMREAAIAVFRMLLDVEDNKLEPITRWAAVNINKDMFEYAIQLASLYGNKFKKEQILPPFVRKPNHFVNSEALWKAMHLKIGQGIINEEDSKLNQYYKNDNIITINTNYSGWNLPLNGCDREINYFKEDIALNSYYYGVHLLHPFWMTNDELDQLNPRHAEHYYFTHKQLMARFKLEKEHLKNAPENATECGKCDINMNTYNSYLMHDYGLPFPIKSPLKAEWNDDRAKLKSIDIAIKECVSRGLLVDNGTAINMTGEYNIDLVSKLIRANLDSPKIAKIVRSLYGYGGNGFPTDKYNPAPSVLHYPETSLRDHTYWHLLKNLLEYFTEYRNTLEPFNLADYENKNFAIVDSNFTDLRTYFDYYQLKNKLVFEPIQLNEVHPVVLNAERIATAVVLRTQEELNDSVGSNLRLDINGHSEWFVVETRLTHFQVCRGTFKFLFRVEYVVADFKVIQIEVGEHGDFTQSIGKTFHVITGNQLLVEEIEHSTAHFFDWFEREAFHPEGIDNIQEGIGVSEVLGIHFVRCGESKVLGVPALVNGEVVGVQEKTIVDVHAGPGGSVVEGFEVFGVVEQLSKDDGFFPHTVVKHREGLVLREEATLVVQHEFFEGLLVLYYALFEEEEFFRIAVDLVITRNKLVYEGVQLNEVHRIGFNAKSRTVDRIAIAVVFGTQEELNDSVGSNLRLDIDGHSEWLVVETRLTHFEVCWGTFKFLFRVEYVVADFKVIQIEVVVPLEEWVVGRQIASVAGLQWLSPGEHGDFTQSIGKTFHVITGNQLLVEEIEHSTAHFFDWFEREAFHPEGIDNIQYSQAKDGYPSSPLPQGAVNVYEEMRDVWDEVFSDVNNYKELHSTIEKCQLNKEDTIKTATTASSDVLNKDAYMPTETMSP